MVRPSWHDDWGWVVRYTLHQCDKSMPWFGMCYDEAMRNGFDFDAYDYHYESYTDLNDNRIMEFSNGHPEQYDVSEYMLRGGIWGDIKGGIRPDFNGPHMPYYSDIVEYDTGFYYVQPGERSVKIDVNEKGTSATLASAIKQEVMQPTVSLADEITRLKCLLDNGALTQEEFDTCKRRLLGM